VETYKSHIVIKIHVKEDLQFCGSESDDSAILPYSIIVFHTCSLAC